MLRKKYILPSLFVTTHIAFQLPIWSFWKMFLTVFRNSGWSTPKSGFLYANPVESTSLSKQPSVCAIDFSQSRKHCNVTHLRVLLRRGPSFGGRETFSNATARWMGMSEEKKKTSSIRRSSGFLGPKISDIIQNEFCRAPCDYKVKIVLRRNLP